MKKYDYKTVHSSILFNNDSLEFDMYYLNELGNEGWKLITIVNEEALLVKEVCPE